MDEEQPQTLQPPAFTLYPLSTHDLKTCYESAHYKLICHLQGPYVDRKHQQLAPLFNVCITNHAPWPVREQRLLKLQRNIKEVLGNVMLRGKYERMVFDIVFQLIETHEHNPPSFLLSPLLNLLSYTCAIRCLQITACFSCTALILRNSHIMWQYLEPQKEGDRVLVMCTESRDRRIILLQYLGEFTFVESQKIMAIAEETSLELIRFQLEKINQTFDLFHH